ncbi:MAG: GNAT family N-acetyltransferase, partial [Albidovulum sp.]|uniref:GNAT family N-acetyltransferase n=1 Tax=Albidovulum sp. TaxID=1872424 RepID=UPI003C7FFCD8
RLLAHLIDDARSAGIERLYLQTGSGPFFAPAVSLYSRHGFAQCPPFAGYFEDPNSIYMTLLCAG